MRDDPNNIDYGIKNKLQTRFKTQDRVKYKPILIKTEKTLHFRLGPAD